MELGDEELAASVRRYYNESLEPSLGQHDFNFVLTDPRLQDNPIVYASEGFCAMTGYAHHEVIGRNCRFLQGPETDRRTVLEIRDAVREERACQVHILNYRKDGNAFWNLFYMAPVYSRKDGSVVHFVGVQTPLSSAAAAPAATTILLASTDSKSVDDDAEGRRRRRTGLGCLQRHGNSVLNDDTQGDDDVGDTDEEQTCVVAKEEDKGRAACAVQTILCDLMENSRIGGGVADKRCNLELVESQVAGVVCSSLMLSLTRIQQSFVLADPKLPDIPIVHASKVFCELTGYSQEEVIGRNCRFLQGPDTDPKAVQKIRESIADQCACTVRILNYRKDKTPFWNHLHLSPVRSAGGEVAFYVGVQLAVDIVDGANDGQGGMTPHMKQLGAIGAVKVAVRSLQGSGLRRSFKKKAEE
ncbi:unnamed protein product [Sphagnum jensenii]|uniref:PAS domain-containing protein n=1 Tax=Sphagnum jensenii TaxID=128206 RepID=A0ABP1B2T0_9BRYO